MPTTEEWFSFVHGTARVVVTIGPIPINQVPSLRIWAITNLRVKPKPELFELLATVSAPLGGPGVVYEDDGTVNVTFGYSLPYVSTFVEDQFLVAVQLVADSVDELDDYVQSRFGGDVANDPLRGT